MPGKFSVLVSVFVVLCGFILCDGQKSDFKRVCYYTNWSQYRSGQGKFLPENIDPFLCTHLVYAFATLDDIHPNRIIHVEWNDETSRWSKGMYERVNDLKYINPNLKTLLAIGGWGQGNRPISKMASSKANRQEFVSSTIDFLRTRGFDGLDIDWEYPAGRGGPPEDKDNLPLLLKELRAGFQNEANKTGLPMLLLAIAVPVGLDRITVGYNIKEINKYVDFINIMAYDFHGAWEDVTDHHSALYKGVKERNPQMNLEWAAKHWNTNGASKDKLIVGIPLYGRGFLLQYKYFTGIGARALGGSSAGRYTNEQGLLSYYEICQKVKEGAKVSWMDDRQVPYLVHNRNWIGYDNPRSVAVKTKWISKNGYGGIMVWSLDHDDFSGTFCGDGKYPLLRTINLTLNSMSEFEVSTTSSTTTTTASTITTTTTTTPTPTTTTPPTTTKMKKKPTTTTTIPTTTSITTTATTSTSKSIGNTVLTVYKDNTSTFISAKNDKNVSLSTGQTNIRNSSKADKISNTERQIEATTMYLAETRNQGVLATTARAPKQVDATTRRDLSTSAGQMGKRRHQEMTQLLREFPKVDTTTAIVPIKRISTSIAKSVPDSTTVQIQRLTPKSTQTANEIINNLKTLTFPKQIVQKTQTLDASSISKNGTDVNLKLNSTIVSITTTKSTSTGKQINKLQAKSNSKIQPDTATTGSPIENVDKENLSRDTKGSIDKKVLHEQEAGKMIGTSSKNVENTQPIVMNSKDLASKKANKGNITEQTVSMSDVRRKTDNRFKLLYIGVSEDKQPKLQSKKKESQPLVSKGTGTASKAIISADVDKTPVIKSNKLETDELGMVNRTVQNKKNITEAKRISKFNTSKGGKVSEDKNANRKVTGASATNVSVDTGANTQNTTVHVPGRKLLQFNGGETQPSGAGGEAGGSSGGSSGGGSFSSVLSSLFSVLSEFSEGFGSRNAPRNANRDRSRTRQRQRTTQTRQDNTAVEVLQTDSVSGQQRSQMRGRVRQETSVKGTDSNGGPIQSEIVETRQIFRNRPNAREPQTEISASRVARRQGQPRAQVQQVQLRDPSRLRNTNANRITNRGVGRPAVRGGGTPQELLARNRINPSQIRDSFFTRIREKEPSLLQLPGFDSLDLGLLESQLLHGTSGNQELQRQGTPESNTRVRVNISKQQTQPVKRRQRGNPTRQSQTRQQMAQPLIPRRAQFQQISSIRAPRNNNRNMSVAVIPLEGLDRSVQRVVKTGPGFRGINQTVNAISRQTLNPPARSPPTRTRQNVKISVETGNTKTQRVQVPRAQERPIPNPVLQPAPVPQRIIQQQRPLVLPTVQSAIVPVRNFVLQQAQAAGQNREVLTLNTGQGRNRVLARNQFIPTPGGTVSTVRLLNPRGTRVITAQGVPITGVTRILTPQGTPLAASGPLPSTLVIQINPMPSQNGGATGTILNGQHQGQSVNIMRAPQNDRKVQITKEPSNPPVTTRAPQSAKQEAMQTPLDVINSERLKKQSAKIAPEISSKSRKRGITKAINSVAAKSIIPKSEVLWKWDV